MTHSSQDIYYGSSNWDVYHWYPSVYEQTFLNPPKTLDALFTINGTIAPSTSTTSGTGSGTSTGSTSSSSTSGLSPSVKYNPCIGFELGLFPSPFQFGYYYGSQFVPFTQFGKRHLGSADDSFFYWKYSTDTEPFIECNVATEEKDYSGNIDIGPLQMVLQPASTMPTIVQFIVPESRYFDIFASFQNAVSSVVRSKVEVRLNDESLAYYDGQRNEPFLNFSQTLFLEGGDTLEFTVTTVSTYSTEDTTFFQLTITESGGTSSSTYSTGSVVNADESGNEDLSKGALVTMIVFSSLTLVVVGIIIFTSGL